MKKEYEKAIADFDAAIQKKPGWALAYYNRGYSWSCTGNYEKSIADYNEAIRIDPGLSDAYNGLAWILATCPDPKHRDGKKAVELATKACELTEWKNAYRDRHAGCRVRRGRRFRWRREVEAQGDRDDSGREKKGRLSRAAGAVSAEKAVSRAGAKITNRFAHSLFMEGNLCSAE